MTAPNGEDESRQSVNWWRRGRGTTILSIIITVAATTLLVLHVWIPSLKLDGISLAFLAIAISPWLGRIFQSISGPGGWKFEWRQAIEYRLEAQELTGRRQMEQISQQRASTSRIEKVASDAKSKARDALLASRYNQARIDFKPQSSERETAMRTVWSDMVDEVRHESDFDVCAHLQSSDDGLRLAGYAYLYANPDNRWRDDLLAALAREKKGFNEEMGLLVLQLLLGDTCDGFDRALERRLIRRAEEIRRKNPDRPHKRIAIIVAILEHCSPSRSEGARPHSDDTR